MTAGPITLVIAPRSSGSEVTLSGLCQLAGFGPRKEVAAGDRILVSLWSVGQSRTCRLDVICINKHDISENRVITENVKYTV